MEVVQGGMSRNRMECSNSGLEAGWCACVTCGGVVRHLLTDYDGPLRRPQAPDLALLQTHLLPSCPQSKGRPIIIQLNLKGTLDGFACRRPNCTHKASIWTLGYSVTEVLRRVKRCMAG